MPSSQGHHNQQRRVFRGRGGHTDGNLPPKKNPRVRVKYQPSGETSEIRAPDGVHEQDDGVLEVDIDGANEGVEQSIDESIANLSLHQEENYPDEKPTPLQLELSHLQKRIHNIQTSLQTSRGLSNPNTWHANCLLPVRNAVKEWKSILLYHVKGGGVYGTSNDKTANHVQSADSKSNDTSNTMPIDILHNTSQRVYGLIQMSMQSGPLLGSNPGYFKRCGGEVALMAYSFLYEIAELADVGGEGDDEEVIQHNVVTEVGLSTQTTDAALCGDGDEDNAIATLDEISDSDDYQSERNASSSDDDTPKDGTATLSDQPISPYTQTMHNLQTTMLFSEKQSQQICQWIRNAQKAMEINKAPSKSSKKLQGQKSKKQQQKELKMERKLKAKKRGGK